MRETGLMFDSQYELLLSKAITGEQLRKIIREIPDDTIYFREFATVEVESGVFFTKRAASEHLAKYSYYFSGDAHIFGRTALDSPEEKLWDITHRVQL